ncbi:pyrroline-5-carboxylate reductase dimerization domain-containing protein [uncultured Paracoccus sp.]|uniref:pyrroline-5-carboxylate reductase family protein n=1 Tax=uncultured Paracoccus sp. TaxID=189685 RepID=UPI00261C69A2|nr:pyrroline-5-carboxylate reductase dimerization domain-containing protein [uncultured Paracoccus sp.]
MQAEFSIGIIGGAGMLGRAIARALLRSGWPEARLWIANRSGSRAGFEDHPGVTVTADTQALADACDLVLLSVPPALAGDLGIHAPDRLVVSVMAGVSAARLVELTGASRVVRAMSSPAAELGLAYSPWFATPEVTEADQARVTALFSPCGLIDRVETEAQVEIFTAMTGPVPGFVAYFAECMADYAIGQGVAPDVADRATRQLFLAAGQMMATGVDRPGDHVQAMVDYDGTTAAGLRVMRNSGIAAGVVAGLDAAIAKTRSIGS